MVKQVEDLPVVERVAKRWWSRFVIPYWVLTIIIVLIESRYMESDWAGLLGFLLTLPLSILILTAYILAAYATEILGYSVHFTENQAEYGLLVCAFLNAFIFYPFYVLWVRRKQQHRCELPPPPPPDSYADPD